MSGELPTTDPGHEQARVELEGRSAEVDAGIAPLILACWRAGLDTLSSCEEIEPGRAYVGFPTREQAERFAWLAGADALSVTDPGFPFARVFVPVEEEEGGWTAAEPDEVRGAVWYPDEEEPPEPPRYFQLIRLHGVETDERGHGTHSDDEGAFVYAVAFSTDDLAAMLAAIREGEEGDDPELR